MWDWCKWKLLANIALCGGLSELLHVNVESLFGEPYCVDFYRLLACATLLYYGSVISRVLFERQTGQKAQDRLTFQWINVVKLEVTQERRLKFEQNHQIESHMRRYQYVSARLYQFHVHTEMIIVCISILDVSICSPPLIVGNLAAKQYFHRTWQTCRIEVTNRFPRDHF